VGIGQRINDANNDGALGVRARASGKMEKE
jgi:hypothetical protein